MFKQIQDLPEHVVGITVSGKITPSDYTDILIPLVDARLETQEKLDLLCVFEEDWDGVDGKAMLRDMKMGLGNFSAWGRLAFVSDSDWLENILSFVGILWPGHLRHFDKDELSYAREWVCNLDRARVNVTVDDIDNMVIIEPSPGRSLTEDDFALISKTVNNHLENHEAVKGILIRSKRFPGWKGIGAMVSHLKFVREHHRAIQKVALVTDSSIGKLADNLVDHFINAEVRAFEFDDHDDAVDWLRS